MSQDTYRALTGNKVTISGVDLDLSKPWSGNAKCMVDGAESGFQTAPVGTIDAAMTQHPAFRFREIYSDFQGGKLRIGWMSVDDAYARELTGRPNGHMTWVASWEGNKYSLFSLFRAQPAERPDFIQQFNEFLITETEIGVCVSAVRTVEMFGISLTKEVPFLGVLTVLSAAHAQNLLPPWRGTPVEGGSLYVSEDHSFFVLASPTAVVAIEPLQEGQVDDPARMRRLEHLRVAWE